MPEHSLAAFLSYVHSDDEHDMGAITRLRDMLQGEVRMQLGEAFDIFVDRDDIAWGQDWKRRIDDSLDAVTLLIPVLTPSFFRGAECRRETERFLERERELRRDDLVLPFYYVSTAELDEPARRDGDPLASALARRQYADWRELRFEPATSPVYRQRLSQLASRMRASFRRNARPAEQGDAVAERPAKRAPSGSGGTGAKPSATSRRSEPPTRTVDPWGRGDHASIREAIEAARPGDRIVVAPGLYEEALVVDKPLEIIGQGPVDEVIVRVRESHAIVFAANIGRIANLAVQQVGEGGWFGIDIAQGRLELEDCDLRSAGRAAVAVRDGADPRLRRNRIHDNAECGLAVFEQGLGSLEDNDIFANVYSCVTVETGANPTLRRNRIHTGLQDGVNVYEALGTFEENDIFGHRHNGVTVEEGSDSTVRANRIHHNEQGGILVKERARGTFEGSDVFENAQAGVTVTTGADPTVRGNRINRNGYEAVWVREGGGGTFDDNDLTGNTRGAWDIAEDSEANVVRGENAT